ncbi:hypothetical protein LB524_16505 [Mesorhizobium sp. ESP6-5]|nr:hypothetical protein [Mesorhizobium sp. ESP6-5]
MGHVQSTRANFLLGAFSSIGRWTSILPHETRGERAGAIFALFLLCLVLLFASPAHSQRAPDASAPLPASDISSDAFTEHVDVGKEADKAPARAFGSHAPGELVPSEAQAPDAEAQTPPGENQEMLRRELDAARAELAKQAQALKEQQRKDEALSLDLQTAQRAIESFRAEATLWGGDKPAPGAAQPSKDVPETAVTQALDDERHKVELLGQELTTAHRTIEALKTAANAAAVELANANKNREAAEAGLRQAGEALELERNRADSAARDLDVVRKERDASNRTSVGLSAAFEEERERATGLALSLSAAREAIDDVATMNRPAAAPRSRMIHKPAGVVASAPPRSGVEPGRKPRSREKQTGKQAAVLAPISLPLALLPTRPPKGLDPRQ